MTRITPNRSNEGRDHWHGIAIAALWVSLGTALTLGLTVVPVKPDQISERVDEQQANMPAPSVPPALTAIQLPPPPPIPEPQSKMPVPPLVEASPIVALQSVQRDTKPLKSEPEMVVRKPVVAPLKATQRKKMAEPAVKPAFEIEPLIAHAKPKSQAKATSPVLKLKPTREAVEMEPTKFDDIPFEDVVVGAIAEPVTEFVEASDPNIKRGPTPVVEPIAETAKTGRVLLRMLEHGSGPHIEIAWPDSGVSRERLFKMFHDCFGMRVAYLDNAGQLFVDEGPRGKAWAPNVDRYSGFLRQPSGPATAAESRALRKILNHHVGRRVGSPVRLFSRRADAVLLGGLSQIVGESYGKAHIVTARYEVQRGRLRVAQVRVDGKIAPGIVDLTSLSPSCVKGA